MAKKAREAFRTISEVADWLDVPAHVLRFWESKFTQIKPVKRAGGRRYYRPSDMELIGGIKTLLHDDGLTIRGVQKILKEEGVKHVAGFSQDLDAPADPAAATERAAARDRRKAVSDEVRKTKPSPIKEDRASIEDAELAEEDAPDAPTIDASQAEPDAPAPETAPEAKAEADPPAEIPQQEVAESAPEPATPEVAASAPPDPSEQNIFAESETPDMFADVAAADTASDEPAEDPEQVPVFEHNRGAASVDAEIVEATEPVPDDPDDGDITLHDAQIKRLAIIAQLRAIAREDHGLDGVALLRPRKRLSELRDRLAETIQ